MASVLELGVSTGKWDAGLRKAKQSLDNFVTSNGGLAQALDRESDKMGKFVQMMGRMDSTAKTARGQMNEYRNTIEQLTRQYNAMSEAQRKTVGPAYLRSIEQLKTKYREASAEVESLNRSLNGTGASGGFLAKLGGNLSLGSLTRLVPAITGISSAFELVSQNVTTAMNFETAISQLSSLTGKTGAELEQLKNYAIELGSTTTLSASQVADAFKMIGSQQPQLLASGEALRDVTKAAITLSEAAGIELATASQTLSTSINQFGGDSNNATRFVNVLAAASQQGAGDIAFLGEAISKSGTLANAVGISYEELVANLEQLAQAGMDASTAGTALRSIIASLEQQSNSEYKPSVVGLTEALSNMNKAHLTTVDYIKLAGKQFFSQAMILAQNADKARDLTTNITGTNTAEEQAATNTDNLAGSLKSLSSAWEGLNLHINSGNGYIRSCVDGLKDVIVFVDKAVQKLDELRGSYDTLDRFLSFPGRSLGRVGDFLGSLFGGGDDGSSGGGGGGGFTGGSGGGGLRGGGESTTTSPTRSAAGASTSTTPKKTGRHGSRNTGTGSTTHKVTPAERAQQVVDAALQSYAETIKVAEMRMTAGIDDEMDYKKKELSAVESLMSAYARASTIYESPEHKTAYEKATESYKSIAKEIKDMEDAVAESKVKWEHVTGGFTDSNVQGWKQMQQARMANMTIGSDEYGKLQGSITSMDSLTNVLHQAMVNGLTIPQDEVTAIFEALFDTDAMPTDLWDGLIDNFIAQWKERTGEELVFDPKTGKMGNKPKEPQDKKTDLVQSFSQFNSGLSSIAGGIEQLGLDIPSGIEKTIATLQAITTIITGISSLVTVIATVSAAKAVPVVGTFLAGGGLIRAAGGFQVPGSRFSGDGIPALLNSGELVLNRAQAGNLASQLQSGGLSDLHLSTAIGAEQIDIVLDNRSRRRGMGRSERIKTN